MMKVQIYTDGSTRGSPDGPGGYGTAPHLTDGGGQLHEKTASGGYVRTTNSRMELMAAIVGLRTLNRPCQMESYPDPKYLTGALNQHWINSWMTKGWNHEESGPVGNVGLWKRLLEAEEPHQVRFIQVKGHVGHPENERCDTLATSTTDGENLTTDQGLEA